MRIREIEITNLRAIERFAASELSDFVVIAGPNGCGKSTVLDAVRLLKSLYVHEEWKRWFSEFSVKLERSPDFSSLLRDKSKPAVIKATFELNDTEKQFLAEHAANIALAIAASTEERNIPVTGEPPVLPPAIVGSREKRLRADADKLAQRFTAALVKSNRFEAAVEISCTPPLQIDPSPVAVAAFNCFNPEHLGEVEFHGSRRVYARESVTNVRLRVGDRTQERRNRFLYDLENKYKNIKTQLAEEYVAAILRGEKPADAPLQQSIKELFRTFFPGKEFEGVSLAGDSALCFPVKLSTGEQHDIDELSSGEKEIVYGYLWLRTGTPRCSVILIDEPELHLNPALVQGLSAFYKTHLADALDAQVWIVTHSDAILRQAVRAEDMAVYHMARALGTDENQTVKIDSKDAVEAAVLDLIGDLAAYRPHARIVLVEGHKDTRFDVDMIRRLFPNYAERGNFIPAGNRHMTAGIRVRLLEILEESGLTGRAVSITDADLGMEGSSHSAGQFVWPVYEIENFLLEPKILRSAAEMLLRKDPFSDDASVFKKLRELGENLIDELATIEVQDALNSEFIGSVNIGASSSDPVPGFVDSTTNSKSRIASVDVSEIRIETILDDTRTRLRKHLDSKDFIKRFPGDRLLRALAGSLSISAEHFRNACLDQAVRLGVRPEGMEDTLRDALG